MRETPSGSFHLLAKPSGSDCNLSCAYCFFRAKSALYPGHLQRMTYATLETYIRQLFDAHPSGEVVVAWQGGEPTLMGLPFFRRSVELAERYRRDDQSVLHTFQTNGILLDGVWAAFLGEHDYLVGVSIDGPADVHDAYRRDSNGAGSHTRVASAIRRLEDRGVRWNALTAVHRANENRGAEVYGHLRDELGAEFIQFIPIVERPTRNGVPFGTSVTRRSVRPQAYGGFMTTVFNEWIRSDVGRVFVQAFDAALAAWAGAAPSVCVHSPTCGQAPALEFNGDVYACDHFVQPDHLLGNINEHPLADLVGSRRQRDFGEAKRELPRICTSCDVAFACNGGCPKDRFVPEASGGPLGNYLCEGYRRFFQDIARPMRTMATLLRSGYAPAEIMRTQGPR